MHSKIRTLLRNQRGITALETAIILIAFVVVASVFAFTILSAGTFTTERGKEAVYAGLAEVRGSLEMRGGVIGRSTAGFTGTNGTITDVVFTVANVASGAPVDFSTSSRVLVIEYRDSSQRKSINDWTVTWLGYNDGDAILEARELAEITVPLSGTLDTHLSTNQTFVIEVKPPQGAVVNIQRTTPANIELVNELN